MKLTCPCGHIVSDTTDELSYKGHILADQDFHPVLDAIDESVIAASTSKNSADEFSRRARNSLIQRLRGIYKCESCGRVGIDDSECQMHWYKPENGIDIHNLLTKRTVR
jgi:diphthamide synthase subunit DPH2